MMGYLQTYISEAETGCFPLQYGLIQLIPSVINTLVMIKASGSYELLALDVPAMKAEKLLMVAEVLCKQCRLQNLIHFAHALETALAFFQLLKPLEVKLDSGLLLKVSKPLVTAKVTIETEDNILRHKMSAMYVL